MIREVHVLHGLCHDRRKHRWRLRVMISRGKKMVGKRLVVDIATTDQDTAVVARDAVLCFATKLGLVVVRRGQARPPREKAG